MNRRLRKQLNLAEKQRQEAKDYIAKELQYSQYLSDPNLNNPCKYEQQIGHSLTSEMFDAKLKKLNPNLTSEVNIHKPDKRCLYLITSTGKRKITPYENGYMPEHSVWAAKDEEVPDLGFMKTKTVGGRTFQHIDKKDIPKSEFVPGKGLVFDSSTNPGFKKVEIPWIEVKRGWRTVLCMLVKEKIATPTEIENIFGSDNSAPWARVMGKQKVANLW